MWKNLLLLLLASMFLGCAHAGRQYDTTAGDRIKVGQTTESEVITMLGRPLTEEKLSNGVTMYRYVHGWRRPIGTTSDRLYLEVYNGVVINKWYDHLEG
jgi:hypothetical protein